MANLDSQGKKKKNKLNRTHTASALFGATQAGHGLPVALELAQGAGSTSSYKELEF